MLNDVITRFSGNKPIFDLLIDMSEKIEKHNVSLIISDDQYIVTGGQKCNGFFEVNGTPPTATLAIAIGKPEEQWLKVLLHEGSHMDQWIEQSVVWNNNVTPEGDGSNTIGAWINGTMELSQEYLSTIINGLIEVELDCEIRTVEKIRKYGISIIDVDTYIKKANSYVWFYYVVGKCKTWYRIGREPYNTKSIIDLMPSHFMKPHEYTTMPQNIFDEYSKIIVDSVI